MWNVGKLGDQRIYVLIRETNPDYYGDPNLSEITEIPKTSVPLSHGDQLQDFWDPLTFLL